MIAMTPSKEQEIQQYRDFVAGLHPNSYLRSILRDTVEEIETMIRDDFAFGYSLAAANARTVDANNELGAKRKELAAADMELRKKLREVESAGEAMAHIRAQARKLANA